MLFILAGHETTASTLQFFWYLICMNPAVQNQIYEEIQQKEKFSYEDIRDFEYWDACIKGKMRKCFQQHRFCQDIVGKVKIVPYNHWTP